MGYFEDLADLRIKRSKKRQLLDIITIAICAVICGANSWVYIELLGKRKPEWFQPFLELPHGIPSHDTPAFAEAGSSATASPGWTPGGGRPGPGEVVAIDVKTARRSHDRNSGKRAMHPISWYRAGSGQRLGLGQHPRIKCGAGSHIGTGQDRG